MADDTTPRERAVQDLAANEQAANNDDSGHCGPEPERPSYFSPQAVRDRHYAWRLCKEGA